MFFASFVSLIVAGLLFPTWVFFILFFVVSFIFRNNTSLLFILLFLDTSYAYSGVSFYALYTLVGVACFLLIWFLGSLTRIKRT